MMGEGEVVLLSTDVSFDDAQIAALSEAGLEPASVRNEIGLEQLAQKKEQNEPVLSFDEALARAKVKYGKV